MLTGVFTLQSCIKYRIKEVEHGSMKYYSPEKRVLFTWEDMFPFNGNDLESTKKTIDGDKLRKVKNYTYLNY